MYKEFGLLLETQIRYVQMPHPTQNFFFLVYFKLGLLGVGRRSIKLLRGCCKFLEDISAYNCVAGLETCGASPKSGAA